jgi:tetratricopeptide (TPR) repeat protein
MIPRVIHQMFVNPEDGGSGGLKDDVLQQCKSWRECHPHYSYKMWDLDEFYRLCESSNRLDIKQTVSVCRFPAMQVDIARLFILKIFGGFWADLKMYTIVPFLDDLRNHRLLFAEHFVKEGWRPGLPCSAFLGAEPGQAFFDAALVHAQARVAARTGETFLVAGPAALEKIIATQFPDGPGIPPDESYYMLDHSLTWDKLFGVGSGSYNHAKESLHWSVRERREPAYADRQCEPPQPGDSPCKAFVPDVADEDQATMLSWAMEQIAPWIVAPQSLSEFDSEMNRLNETFPDVSVLVVENGAVRVREKPAAIRDVYPPERIDAYKMWIEESVRKFCPELNTAFALYPVDGAWPDPPIPMFSFQKPVGNRSLLLPDIELIASRPLKTPDGMGYSDKECRAVFVGSTTGGLVTRAAIREGIPRVRAALFFRGSPDVSFALPKIVQCDSEETIELLRSMGFGDNKTVSWDEQLGCKFIISMDGNGASCSRIFMTLRSNSALIKYESENVLYYFSGLRPWRHYIPVERDEDIPRLVELERRCPGTFNYISEEGNRFASRFLTRESALRYTAYLLQVYRDLVTAKSDRHAPQAQNAGACATDLGGDDVAVSPAVTLLRHLVANPTDAGVRGRLAYCLADQGLLERAIEVLQDGLKLDPDDLGLLFAFSHICVRVHRLDEALSAAQRTVQIDPSQFHPQMHLGYLLSGAGLLGDAEAAFRSAEHLRASDPRPPAALADVLERLGRLREAVAAAERAVALAPGDPVVAGRRDALRAAVSPTAQGDVAEQ